MEHDQEEIQFHTCVAGVFSTVQKAGDSINTRLVTIHLPVASNEKSPVAWHDDFLVFTQMENWNGWEKEAGDVR